MGNNCECSGAREQLYDKSQKGKELYGRVSKSAKKKYSYARLKLKGYKFNNNQDDSETQRITQMENNIALVSVALDDFEQRLTDFYIKEKTNKMTIPQVIECFKSNQFLDDIIDEASFSRKILTHKVLSNTKNTIYLPYLRLLGILICASTPKMKAEAFYKILQPEDLDSRDQPNKTTDILKSEVLIPEYFEKMLEISYVLMIDLYSHMDGGEDKTSWIIDELEDIYKEVYDVFLKDVFGND